MCTFNMEEKEVIKKIIKGIAHIGSSKPEFNYDRLIIEAQDSLKGIFDECLRKEIDEFDYSVFTYSLERLVEKAFEENIKGGIQANIAILYHIAKSFESRELRINPTISVIQTLRNIGIRCAEKRWEDLLFICFNTLLVLGRDLSQELKYHLMSFCSAIVVASFCNKYIPEVLPRIEDILKREIKDLEEVKKYSLDDTRVYSQIQYSVLREYLSKSRI